MKPEEALEVARAQAARRRAEGGYAEGDVPVSVEPTGQVTRAQLLEWAVIEPDATLMRSTRRFGGPITWLKRLLLRGLQQYHNEIVSQQTRFNLQLLRHVLELEDRLDRLEKRR